MVLVYRITLLSQSVSSVTREENDPTGIFAGKLQLRLKELNWRHWAFYLGAPLLLGIEATFENWWLLELSGLTNALLFYCGHALLPWWLTCATTFVAWKVLTPWRPNQVIVMLLGVSIALLLSNPYGEWLDTRFLSPAMEAAHSGGVNRDLLNSRFSRFWAYLFQPAVFWVGINLLFDRFLQFPRYRYSTPGDVDPAAPSDTNTPPDLLPGFHEAVASEPRFLRHLDETPKFQEILAIKAEQHYIKLHTEDRDYMILYRFSDAIAELEKNAGLQVHRSYWIRSSAVEEIKTESKKMTVRLKSGMEIPVSQPYQALVRQMTTDQPSKQSPRIRKRARSAIDDTAAP